VTPQNWQPETWQNFQTQQQVQYADTLSLQRVLKTLHQYPPLVFVGEIETLKKRLAEATYGHGFLLQGGDCVESFNDCKTEIIRDKVKILLQMASILCYGMQKPVVCVARLAGQYSKPRSSAFEISEGLELPVFRGESINGIEASLSARTPDPLRLLHCYQNSALTLNYIRSLASGGFADFHHPEQWDLGIFKESEYYRMYNELTENMRRAIRFMISLGGSSSELRHMNFFTCHEGLHLPFEQALTHFVTDKGQHYNLNAHMLWIGDRTRQIDGGHIEYFRGIANPIGIKLGPTADPEEILRMLDILNPKNEAGRITLVTRLGSEKLSNKLPPLIKAINRSGKCVLWSCDPMHGNTIVSKNNRKTRLFSTVMSELYHTFRIHREMGSYLGGVHFELTGENVTECLGGLENLEEGDLEKNYRTYCDPRLNYQQSLEVAFTLASLMQNPLAEYTSH
jgi:3-deoxy-7-phosphoheptulonate synthase